MPRTAALLATMAVASSASAQPFVRDLDLAAAFRDTVPYLEPLSGGLNAPMQQFHDLDGDGDLDLFIFDSDFHAERLFFRNTGSSGAASFRLEPGGGFRGASFSAWFLFADHDGDGDAELLTDDGGTGISVWRNDHLPADPVWTLETPVLLDSAGDPVFAGFGGLPGFADLDGDSLPDFVSGNPADGSFNYYRNAGAPGSPAFVLVTTSLGGITITTDTCTQSASAPPRSSGRRPAGHGLGAVAFRDLDADGDADLFYGDLFAQGLFQLPNAGTPTAPDIVCGTNNFPPGGQLSTPGFNQSSFADIDGDGDPDLFVGVLNSRTRNSFWFYRNVGVPGAPVFSFVTREFLPTLDAGQNSRPAVADLDGDGDADLVVGNNDGELWHFANDGSALAPVFRLADTAFGGIGGNFSYAPAFADMDGDGDPDLFLGRFDGRVILFGNEGGGVFVPRDTLTVGQFAVPAAGDVDGDGDNDLVVGLGNGTLTYVRNDGGPAGFAAAAPVTGYLGVDLGDHARPAFRRNPLSGLADLYVAPAAGDTAPGGRTLLYHFRNTGEPVPEPFADEGAAASPGLPFEAAPVFADLDGDGDDDLLAGTSKGGLVVYRNDEPASAGDPDPLPRTFRLHPNHPNPFNGSTVITLAIDRAAEVTAEVFDAAGRAVGRIEAGRLPAGTHRLTWNAGDLPTGLYACRVRAGDRTGIVKMLLIK